jgi:hypothetical protein
MFPHPGALFSSQAKIQFRRAEASIDTPESRNIFTHLLLVEVGSETPEEKVETGISKAAPSEFAGMTRRFSKCASCAIQC